MTMKLSRRSALRGVLAGSAVTIGMPFLDCFLNTNGTALAATGAPLPLRFGTWFWGLGFTPNRWVPTHGGANYDLLPELKAIEPHKNKISILSGFNVNLDGTPNSAHISGVYSVRTGIAPKTASRAEGPSFDALIAASAGKGTRFQSLELTATGDPKHSYSRPSGDIVNPGEPSPLALYKRIFGPEFRDPNAAEFHPDPGVMLKKSVLSAVLAESRDTLKNMGQADRVIKLLAEQGLRRGEDGLRIIMMCEVPSNAILADEFLKYFDGFSIGSNDLTQLTLGLDRDSGLELLAADFDERDPAVQAMLSRAIQACTKQGKYVGICGQGPSDHPDFAQWLVDEGIASISLNPDSVIATWQQLAAGRAP